jgi:hypothetical protein
MKTNKQSKLLFVSALAATSFAAPTLETKAQSHQAAHIGFVYPLSTNGTKAPNVSNTVSLHALAGVSGGETGTAISGLATIVNGDQRGVIISGLVNTISQAAKGVQVAGLVNVLPGENTGLAIAGLTNISNSTKGAMVAGLSNVTNNESNAQVSGLYNQSGATNIQIAGLINVAKKVKGTQIAGLINIAEENDCPIGFVNIIGNGEKQIGLTYDESGNSILAFRSGGKKTYGIIGLGFNTRLEHARYALEAGFGYHAHISRQFRLNLEATATTSTDFWDAAYYKSSFSVLAGYKFAKRIEIVAGPSFNYVNYLNGLAKYTDYSLYNFYGQRATNSLFLGARAGIHISI